jgi:peptide/nickel transport system permease protein
VLSAQTAAVDAVEQEQDIEVSASPWRQLVRSVTRSPSGMTGLLLLLALILIAIFAPLLAPYNPNTQVGAPFAPPSAKHLLGLDDGGYDVTSLLMYGLRVSLLVGVAATAIATGVGTVVGVVAGYFGGLTDGILMRTTDYFLVVPLLPLMIVVADLWGASLLHIIIVIGVLSWTMTAIVIRAQARALRERTFIRRATAIGASHARVIIRHLLPQVMPLVVANTVLNISYAIFTETALSFLGLGDPTQVSLGTMIEHAFLRAAISAGAWWAVIPPGALVVLVVVASSLLGRTIEDGLNPRLRTSYLSVRTFQMRSKPPRAVARLDAGAKSA